MAYVAPPNFVAGAVLTEANLDVLSDDIAYLYGATSAQSFSGCQVTRDAATNAADSTETPITWTAEPFDLGNWWTSGTNIVVPATAIPAGYTTIMLMVSARTRFAANGTGYRYLRALKNGTAFGYVNGSAINGETTDLVMVEFVTAVVGDIITVAVYQNSTGALNYTQSQVTVARYAPIS